jgi:hypothetical protein
LPGLLNSSDERIASIEKNKVSNFNQKICKRLREGYIHPMSERVRTGIASCTGSGKS